MLERAQNFASENRILIFTLLLNKLASLVKILNSLSSSAFFFFHLKDRNNNTYILREL